MFRTLRTAAVVALAAVLMGLAPAAAADTAPDPASGPADVAIPYDDAASIEPQAPWRIADCAAVSAESPLVRACDAESIELRADGYDPEAGVTRLPVRLVAGDRTLEVSYRVTLEAPAAPSVTSPGERAVASGAILRVPLSDFAPACIACAAGGGTRVVDVDPVEAGTAWTTPTHVVFRAAAGYRGAADVHVEVVDDHGSAARTGIPVSVYPARAEAELIALDVTVPLSAEGGAEIDLRTLVASRSGDEVVVVGCGAPLHGAVACDRDGVARYRGTGAEDQFSFHVAAGGEQAWGSVTLVPGGTAEGPVPTAPSAAAVDGAAVAMGIVPPIPPEGGSAADDGMFRALSAVLDRVGAQ